MAYLRAKKPSRREEASEQVRKRKTTSGRAKTPRVNRLPSDNSTSIHTLTFSLPPSSC